MFAKENPIKTDDANQNMANGEGKKYLSAVLTQEKNKHEKV